MAVMANKKTSNNRVAEALQLTTQTEDVETVRLFRLLYELSKKDRIMFDPLGLFGKDN